MGLEPSILFDREGSGFLGMYHHFQGRNAIIFSLVVSGGVNLVLWFRELKVDCLDIFLEAENTCGAVSAASSCP